MSFAMAYYPVTLAVILIAHTTIFPVNGQCTVKGCDDGDPLINVFAEMIQQLRVDLFEQLSKQVQSNNELNASIQEMKGQLGVVMASLQIVDKVLNASFEEMKSQIGTLNNLSSTAVDRCPLEQDICREQFQGMHENLNKSFQEMKSQHDAILTNLQAVDRRLEKHDISIRNQTRNCFEEHDISVKNQTQNSQTFENVTCDPAFEVCDCSYIKARGQNLSGVYEVCVGRQPQRICSSAFCDMETANRASLVFQRRKDGSVNFKRTWTEFRSGFGNPDGEFWLGNEMLYLLTSKRNYKLRVDLEDWEGEKVYAEYSTFSISSSADNYRLTLGRYSGNAGDSMSSNSGKQFTTIDADNDENEGNCAQAYGGAWWHFDGCSYASLNGKYHQPGVYVKLGTGIHWNHFHPLFKYSLKATEMRLVTLT